YQALSWPAKVSPITDCNFAPEPSTQATDMTDSNPVANNLESIRTRIKTAAQRSGRDPQSVRLLAVTKYATDEQVQALYKAGQREFGESRIQDALPRQNRFPSDCSWHMIGHLQRNKAKLAIGTFALIHSLDNERLMHKLASDHERLEIDIPIPVLLEVNISR